MADHEMGISVKVTGEKTIGDLRKEMLTLSKSFDQLPVSAKDAQVKMGAEIKALKDEIATLKSVTLSSNAQMKDSYFKLGEELRRTATPSVLEFTRVIQDAPYGIRGVANNIQQLSTTFGQLTQSAGGVMPALKAMMMTMLSGPMAIMTGVSVVTSLAVAFGDKLFPSAEKSAKEIDKVKESLESAQKAINDFVSSIDKWESKLKGKDSGAKTSASKEESKLLMANITALQQVIDAQANGTNVVLNDQYLSMAEQTAQRLQAEAAIGRTLAQNKIILAGLKTDYEATASAAMAVVVTPGSGRTAGEPQKLGVSGAGVLRGKNFNLTNPLLPGLSDFKPINAKALAFDKGKKQAPSFDELFQEFGGFQDAFMSGIGAMSREITSEIGGAFASVFGGAKTLMGQFVSAFTQALADLAIKAAAAWTFNSLFPGLGSLIGLGGPGKSISDSAMRPRAGGSFSPSFSVVPIVDNQGLAVAVSIGQQQRRKRTF